MSESILNIRKLLLNEHSKRQTNRIVNYIGADDKKFAALMKIFFSDDLLLAQRSAWCVSYCSEKHPHLIIPYLKNMIDLLDRDVHNAVKRNIVRTLQYIEIPKKYFGKLTSSCFSLLLSKAEPVAVKVFAMTIIEKISKYEPDLKNELRLIITEQLPYSSAGFKSRSKKILSAIASEKKPAKRLN